MASDSSSGTGNAESNRITVDSVLEALENLKEVNGSSLNSLKKYFTATSPVHLPGTDVSSQIKKALAKGIRDGKIAKFGKSKFSLGLEDDGTNKKHRRRAIGDDEEQAGPVRRQRSKKRSKRRRSRGRGRSRRGSKKSKSSRSGGRKRRRRRRRRRGKKSKSKKRSRSRGRSRRGSRKGRRGKSRKRR
ncbi:hypothetical protein ElyMa_004342300 [Elysia marginata]|uniref:H15 domain-containing protein n=1 Tax=Elysia marginata TaxID=1093978 RepID=A0AAV4H311_9GAST|nr:hypothetical protein ElyMa_004342300 [Elysia marginata]